MSFEGTIGKRAGALISCAVLLGLAACGSPATTDPNGTGGSSDDTGETGGDDTSGTGSAATGGASSGGSSNGTGASNGTGGAASGGSDGTGGEWGTDPTKIYESAKLDILFVIDDSSSMLDKQYYLEKAVPGLLLEHLADPPCVLASGEIAAEVAGECPEGSARAHAPVTDVHLGVITTSVGSVGSATCSTKDDRSRFLPVARPSLSLPKDDALGFLKFSAGNELLDVSYDLQTTIAAAGAEGCGFEQPLEAIYRFLVDPNPGLSYERIGSATNEKDTDTQVLNQRAAFLRPDSAVLVVLLSDEDDCSTMAGGNYYAAAASGWVALDHTIPMRRGSAQCDTDPNDVCCYSCFLTTPPAGCESTCPVDSSLSTEEDVPNLRCFDQKRRFGMEFTYPTKRYIDAFTQAKIPSTRDPECELGECPLVDNPLFPLVGGKSRDPSMVLLLGIVGVPWQDVATTGSLSGSGLAFMTPSELAKAGRWDVILGDPKTGVPPTDPFMVQTPNERSGKNPITNDSIVTSSSTNPRANAINGHETQTDKLAAKALQPACIFELPTPIPPCADDKCECASIQVNANSAVCQPPGGGAAGTTQYFAQAYPASRILEVLKGMGESGLVTSICPKSPIGDQSNVNYGYNPAMNAAHRALWRALE